MNAKSVSGKSDQEESMEDILHSIRDIIAEEEAAEDDALANIMDKPDARVAEAEPETEVEDVLELTEVVEDIDPNDLLASIDAALDDNQEDESSDLTATLEDIRNSIAEPVVEEKPFEMEMPVERAATPAEEPATPLTQVKQRFEPAQESLLSEETARATENSLRSFIHNIPRPEIESPVFRGGSTLEDLVIETLKPMLSEWLDKNLATMVEELVQREIRKLIPRE